MAQIFKPAMNSVARASIAGGVIIALAGALAAGALYRSPFVTQQTVPRAQPVPFSHKHHVTDLGLDCRLCHASVETSAAAGMPPTETCMSCHSQIWADAPTIKPIQESWKMGKPLEWTRVNDLPDFVYFNHSIHVAKGVGCATCHGPVDQMPLTYKAQSLHMSWCLDCHRDPAQYLRPKDQVFNMQYAPPADQAALGHRLVEEYRVKVDQLSDCSVCHR